MDLPKIAKEVLSSLAAAAVLLTGLATLVAAPSPASALAFRLDASNLSIDAPSPLFSTATVGGRLDIDDAVAPGGGFGQAQILGFTFNFAGIVVTLSDVAGPGGNITVFGTRSSDGTTLSFLDLRFDLPATFASCSFICAGQVEIGTFDRSNFVAVDDLDAATTSLLQFDAALVAVPEPTGATTLGVALAGLAMLLALLRRTGPGSVPPGGHRWRARPIAP